MSRMIALGVLFGIVSGGCTSPTPTEAGSHGHWSYEGDTGPAHWGDLDSSYGLAKTGKSQSPINLVASITETAPRLRFEYGESAIHEVNNGHTIQENCDPGSAVRVGSERFALRQFHFHSPSEHHLEGKGSPLECHLVHQNEAGDLLVIGILFEVGEENPFLARVWSHIPARPGEEVHVESVRLKIADLLPKSHTSYRYEGSLTTPPCTENVRWIVFEETMPLSRKQLAHFRRFYHHNNRPLQPTNDRPVLKAN